MLHDFIKTLGQELDLPEGIQETSENVWVLSISPDQDVTFVGLDQGAYIYAKLGQRPKRQMEVFLQNLMHANLFGQGTKGAVIGLDDEGENFTLSLATTQLTDYQDFRNRFEDFLNSLDYWTSELNKQQKEPIKSFY